MERENKYVVGKCRVEEIEYSTDWKKLASEVAAVSRNKNESKNPERRFESLIKEAALSTPSRAFEFLPVILKAHVFKGYVQLEPLRYGHKHCPKSVNIDLNVFLSKIARFSYIEIDENQTEYLVYTNARTLLKAGYYFDDIPIYSQSYVDDYKIVRITCPYFVWAQLMTHTALSKISQSDRVSGSDEYWLPDDIAERTKKYIEERFPGEEDTSGDYMSELLEALVTKYSQEELFKLFRDMGYPREIWSRAIYYFKMKTFIMGGWRNDPHTWDNLFLERGVFLDRWKKTWVQKETQEVAKMIEKIVNK